MAVELTQLSCQPAGEDGRTVEVVLDLLAQAQVWSRRPVTLLQDLYSTALQTQVEREEQVLWQLVEQSSRTQNVRELMETGALPRSVTDSWVSLGEIRRSREGTSWCWRARPGSPSSTWTRTTPSRPSSGP